MEYKNLEGLISSNKSSREYFFTLPVDVQLELSLKGEYIKTPDELHVYARSAEKERRNEILSLSKYT